MDKFKNYKLASELYDCVMDELSRTEDLNVIDLFSESIKSRSSLASLPYNFQRAMANAVGKFIDNHSEEKRKWEWDELQSIPYKERFEDSGIAGVEEYSEEQKQDMMNAAQQNQSDASHRESITKPHTLEEWL